MTERERSTTRGLYYRMTGNWKKCEEVYGELLGRYPGDVLAHNQRALCLALLRDMRSAVGEMQQALQIVPTHRLFRANLAIYSNYAGDFPTAERESRRVPQPTDLATLALAYAQIGQGQMQDATETYRQLATMSARGASWAAAGLGDLALYEGRFSDAARQFELGAAADLAAKIRERASRKFAALAYAELWRGRKDLAIAAAEKALTHSQTGSVRFLAARVFVQAGAIARARTEAARISLGNFVEPDARADALGPTAEPEAYAKIIEGEIALVNEDARLSIKLLAEANALADTWLGHFALGLAYLKIHSFAAASSEFDRCLKRRGEVVSLFFDEEPTHGFLPAVFYYQGLALAGLSSGDSADAFRSYIDLRGTSIEDPLLADARKRVGH
jgi:tetratricopeptide (TPR) repeat protein